MNLQRIETRRTYGVLRGVQDAQSALISAEYFEAIYDSPEKAAAMHNFHAAKVAMHSR
jgi:hypothetical protein